MTLAFDLYWSFRSPYSYMVTPRIFELVSNYDCECRARPVYPTAVRDPEFFKQVDPLWLSYFLLDMERTAKFHGLAFRWPQPDPVVQSDETGYDCPQPRIERLTRMGVAAEEAGRGIHFLYHVSHLLWHGGIDGWDQGDHLRKAAESSGLDPDRLEQTVENEAERLESQIQANQAAHREAGHWGVPLMVFDGEPFFGQDRFDQLKWRLEQHGLRPRT